MRRHKVGPHHIGRSTEAPSCGRRYADCVTIYRSTEDGPVPLADEAPDRTSWRAAPFSALRGGLIGAAEAMPGVSGGTIALMVGLYDKLIDSAGQLLHSARMLVSGVVRRQGIGPAVRSLRMIDWPLLVPVLAGMAVILLVTLMTVAPLLEDHPVPMLALFFGMIAVSIAIPLRMMPERFRPLDGVFMAVAAVAAFLLTGLPESELSNPPLWMVFFGAAIAINALVLPGVSGSFLLLAMGLYVPVQHAVSDRDLAFIAVFGLGAMIGLGSFVKLLQWLLHHRRQATMAVLAGLMLGSLRSLWPWQGEDNALQAPSGAVLGPILLTLLGAAVVAAAILYEARRTRNREREAQPEEG
jgi:putative membrane protein